MKTSQPCGCVNHKFSAAHNPFLHSFSRVGALGVVACDYSGSSSGGVDGCGGAPCLSGVVVAALLPLGVPQVVVTVATQNHRAPQERAEPTHPAYSEMLNYNRPSSA